MWTIISRSWKFDFWSELFLHSSDFTKLVTSKMHALGAVAAIENQWGIRTCLFIPKIPISYIDDRFLLTDFWYQITGRLYRHSVSMVAFFTFEIWTWMCDFNYGQDILRLNILLRRLSVYVRMTPFQQIQGTVL